MKTLQNLLEKLYEGSNTKPIVLGPGGFFDATWFEDFIRKTTKSLQAITHHVYNIGAGKPTDTTHKYLLIHKGKNYQHEIFRNSEVKWRTILQRTRVTGSNLVNPDSVDLTLIPLLFNGELALHITFFFQKLSPYQSKLAEDN